MLCKEWSLVKSYCHGVEIKPLLCKCWHCENCAPMRERDLRDLAKLGGATTFITLTVNPAMFSSPDERARELVNAWRNVRRAMKKRWKMRSVPFLAVFEKTKKGEPHLHILTRLQFVAQEWLSAQMQRLIGAPIVDIRRVRSQQKAAYYISKYCSKDATLWKGCKRYWRSLDWTRGRAVRRQEKNLDVLCWGRWKMPSFRTIATFIGWGWCGTILGETAKLKPPSRRANPP